jgi:uncharacterized protein (TIGR02270 family)
MLQGIVKEIVREHVQLAAFQWSQLRALSQAHPPDQAAIDAVEARLRANLDAIEIAGNAAWPLILDQFDEFPEAGELFVAAYLAMARGDPKRIDQCLWMAHQRPAARAGLAGGFGWFAPETSAPTIRRMLSAASEVQRAAALDVLAAHKADAGGRLPDFLADPSLMVRASACALAAATGRADCVALIADLAASSPPDLRFEAAAALARLDRSDAVFAPLKAVIEGEGPHKMAALRLLSETAAATEFRSYLGELYRRDSTRSLAVRGIGMTGDRSHLDWLIGQMEAPETAAEAGESFLEFFPEAGEVEGLFGEQPSVSEKRAKEPAYADRYPIAQNIRAWADAHAPEEDSAARSSRK